MPSPLPKRAAKDIPAFAPNTLNAADLMRQVSRQVDKQLSKKLDLWARTVNKNVSRGEGLESLHREVAEGARARVLSAYEGSGIGKTPSYRYGDRGKFRRYADGKMEQAIKNPNTIRYDRKGISFIDKSEMDRFAKQWYRLNFGTGSGGRKVPSAQPMRFFGVTTSMRASLDANKPSDSFAVPPGYWAGEASATTRGAVLSTAGPMLYVFRKRKSDNAIAGDAVKVSRRWRGAKDIQGKSFLDAGASYINSRYPRKLEALMKTWLSDR